MSKVIGTFSVVAGLICSLGSISNFTNYATKEKGFEVELLRGSSAYVQQYEGESPKEPLAYLQTTMDIAKRNNAFQERVSELEKEVQEVSTQIGESKSPMVYKPVLKNVGEKVDAIVRAKAVKSYTILFGIGLAGLSLINFGIGAYNFSKRN